MPRSSSESRLRPFLTRPGATFRCHADGFCCTNIHLIRPISRPERSTLEHFRTGCTGRDPNTGVYYLHTGADGACVLLKNGMCTLHSSAGFNEKPRICRRFPYGLAATPHGGRITTAHRCPCRTVGERAAINIEEAERSLVDSRGRLLVNVRAGNRIPWTERTNMSFDSYARRESEMLSALATGAEPVAVLQMENQKTRPAKETWEHLARGFREGDRFGTPGAALAWFGHALLRLLGFDDPAPVRPWSVRMASIQAQRASTNTPEETLGDWLSDAIWDLSWLGYGSFEIARRELAIRVRIFEVLVETFSIGGTRPDVAAAEAVMIVELAGGSVRWQNAAGTLGV
ncbi:MAG: hypothetical protein IPK82_21595 [Polyangiaceae bacterium]|nr:hypothetical protein [Polyangiaceae bacterium]